MTRNLQISPKTGVLVAMVVVIGLGGLLVVRAAVTDLRTALPAAPPATVPEAKPIDVSALAIPCWACPDANEWPLRFRTDLDLLAPLGTGKGNAGVWFGAFAKVSGPRAAEGMAALARRVQVPGVGDVLPPDDPLLLEAEPWCDQATMRFYPDVLPLNGWKTELTNLILPLTYARSWVARGQQASRFEDAMADFRRVIRLGRLLRQEDVVLINDLVGLACIRIGAEAVYDRARRDGRLDLALAAAVVAGEAPAQKLLSAARITSSDTEPYVRGRAGQPRTMELPAGHLEKLQRTATASPDRRFRAEAMLQLQVVTWLGTAEERAAARQALEALSRDEDRIVATTARWCLEQPPMEADELDELLGRLP
jgi:hypothetical protein